MTIRLADAAVTPDTSSTPASHTSLRSRVSPDDLAGRLGFGELPAFI